MNKRRRKEVSDIMTELGNIAERIEALSEEEQEYIDCMPENLQQSERAEQAAEHVDNLVNAASYIEEVNAFLEEVAG